MHTLKVYRYLLGAALIGLVGCEVGEEQPEDLPAILDDMEAETAKTLAASSVDGVLQVVRPEGDTAYGGCDQIVFGRTRWWGVQLYASTCDGQRGELCTWGVTWTGVELPELCEDVECSCVNGS